KHRPDFWNCSSAASSAIPPGVAGSWAGLGLPLADWPSVLAQGGFGAQRAFVEESPNCKKSVLPHRSCQRGVSAMMNCGGRPLPCRKEPAHAIVAAQRLLVGCVVALQHLAPGRRKGHMPNERWVRATAPRK